MQIDDTTLFSDVAHFIPYLEQSSIKDIKSAAERKFGTPWGLTIGELFTCMDGEFGIIGVDKRHPETLTAFQYYWMESFKDMCESLSKTLNALSVEQSADAKQASAACRPMGFQEGIKVFCREYFGLHSFGAVGALTLDDLLLAKKDQYNKAIFEKGMAHILSLKNKKK